ncbi:MAG: hypothetical protein WB989_19825 [Mycobacterium sp.]
MWAESVNMWRLRTSQGIRQITERLGALDAEVFEAIANSHSPLLDKAMPGLARSAVIVSRPSRTVASGPWPDRSGYFGTQH